MPSQGKWEGLDARRCLFSRKNETPTHTDDPSSDRIRPRRTRMAHRVTRQDPDPHGWLAEGQDETSTRTDDSSMDKTRPRPARMAHRVTRRDLDTHGWLAEEQDETSAHMDGSPGNGMRTKSKGEIKRTLRMIRLEGDSSDVDHPETFASDGGREGSEALTPK